VALRRHSGGFDAGSLELLTLSPLQRSRVPDHVDDNDGKGNKMEDVAQSRQSHFKRPLPPQPVAEAKAASRYMLV
jgi:hypothetical protein